MSRTSRMAMVERARPALSLVRQCDLLGLSRSSIYYRPVTAERSACELMVLSYCQKLVTRVSGGAFG